MEMMCGTQAALTKVIATAILSPEQVGLILQSEKEEVKKNGDTGGEGDDAKVIGGEITVTRDKPIFQNKVQAKLVAQLSKLPHLVNSYNFLKDMEEELKKDGKEVSKELQGAIRCQ